MPEPAKPKVFIATPAYGGLVASEYAGSLAALILDLARHGIDAEYYSPASSDIALLRDLCAARFERSDCSHLLFIDADVEFPAALGRSLLAADEDLIGAVYPKKDIDAQALEKAIRSGRAFADALALAQDFNVLLLDNRIRVSNGVGEVAGLGMGFTLIARRCLDRMRASGTVQTYRYHGTECRPYFRRLETSGGEPLSEDYSFCARARQAGVKVMAHIGADLGHIGRFRYGGPYERRLTLLGG